MRSLLPCLLIVIFNSCSQSTEKKTSSLNTNINELATSYIKLGLSIGAYDPDFVDAYYGPDSLKPVGNKNAVFPKDSFLLAIRSLKNQFDNIENNDSVAFSRARWISAQLTAFERRVKIFSGEFGDFDKESQELFGATATVFKEGFFESELKKLDSVLPGSGAVSERFQLLANKFIIPEARIDTVFKAAIAEAKRKTGNYFALPSNEDFRLEYVNDKPWSGYNWYKGNYQSLIQINKDLNIFVDRAIDVGSHESYPGHHVYNMLLEKDLYRNKGYIEISLYPLFSPQSLIAEGTANYGIDMAFPGIEKERFTKEVLLPLAGLDTSGLSLYYRALSIRQNLNFVRNEVARGLINNTMNEAEAMRWLKTYSLYNEETAKKSISFIMKNRSYVINYNYGLQLVRDYIEKGLNPSDENEKWNRFKVILSSQVLPADLQK